MASSIARKQWTARAGLRRATLLAGLTLAGSACDARTYAGTLRQDGFAGAPMLPAVPDDPSFIIPSALVGTWSGYFQGYTLLSGSDAVTLALEHPAGGGDQIRVVFGTEPPPALPTAATDAWIAGSAPPDFVSPLANYGPFDGFAYVAHEVRWQGRRLTFSIATWDPWQTWCQLQTSYPYPNGNRNRCVPHDAECFNCFGGSPAPGTLCGPSPSTGVVATCAQAERCVAELPCVCDAVVCESDPDRNRGFDLTFDTDLAGSGTMLPQSATLRFMR